MNFEYPSTLLKKGKSLLAHFVADAPESDKKDLLSELEVMKTLKPHPHVIKLLGSDTESGKVLTKILSSFLGFIIILTLICYLLNVTCIQRKSGLLLSSFVICCNGRNVV